MKIKYFYLLLLLCLGVVGIFVWYDNKYLALPKIKECDMEKFVVENNLQNQFVNHDSMLINFDSISQNKILLVDFFFTRCGYICPKVTLGVKYLFDNIQPSMKDNLKVLSFSVDPENDDTHELKIYRERYQISENQNWQHITGKKGAIYRLIREQFNVSATPANKEENDFIHSSQIVLLDQKQNIRGYYDGTDSLQLQKLLKNLNQLN